MKWCFSGKTGQDCHVRYKSCKKDASWYFSAVCCPKAERFLAMIKMKTAIWLSMKSRQL
jgi:hypothetical protein